MGSYLRLVGSLAQNLVRRVGEDLADCAAGCKRGLLYKLRSIRLRYDDVGPATGDPHDNDWQALPEQLALLVKSVENKPWFCELDRRSAQHLVHDGGSGCFLVRPSTSTKSLTLTLWYQHRAYNILIRQREDGLLALGSKKGHEMTFRSVDEMVSYYEREPLILYSGGELTGRTRLKAPPPGLVRGNSASMVSISSTCPLVDPNRVDSRRSSSLSGARKPSELESLEEFHRVPFLCSRTLSSGSVDVPLSSSISRTFTISTPNMEQMLVPHTITEHRRLSSETIPDTGDILLPPVGTPRASGSVTLPEHYLNRPLPPIVDADARTPPLPKRPSTTFPTINRKIPSLSISTTNEISFDSTCL